MKNIQYHFPNRVINQMNIPFTVKLATFDPDEIVMEQLDWVTEKIKKRLHQIDMDFSPFRTDSLVSRFQSGDRDPILESKDFQSVYAQSVLAEQMTDSLFTPYFSGHYDPTGLVKGWAIEQSFNDYLKPLLQDPKIYGVSLNGGGDMKLATRSDNDFCWGIGIENPENLQEIVAVYYLKNGSVATSGNNKRGEHIVRLDDNDVKQATIISDSLVNADIWATTGIAAGHAKFLEMIAQNDLSGLLVNKDYTLTGFSKGVLVNAQKTPL